MNRAAAWLIGSLLAFTAVVLFGVVPALEGAGASHYSIRFADDYDKIAASLERGDGYRLGKGLAETIIREPAYPVALAGAFDLFGYNLEAARLLNLLLAAVTAILLWRLALRVTGQPAAALAAVAILLLHPGVLMAEARGGIEVPFLCAMVAFFAALYRAIDTGRTGAYFLAGVTLGVAVLVRSTPLLFPLVLLPWLVWSASPDIRWRRAMQGAVLLAGMGLAMSPWVMRNWALTGAFIPTATVFGVAAHEGQYTCERISFGRGHQELQFEAAAERNRIAARMGLSFKPDFFQYFHTTADEVAFNRALTTQWKDRYRESPALLARCTAQNFVHFWILGKNGFATALNAGLQLPLLALALSGLWALGRARAATAWMPAALFVGYVVAVHLPLMAHARHSVMLLPFLAMFAGVGLHTLWMKTRIPVFLKQYGRA